MATTIYGCVNADGSVHSGSECFNPTKLETGIYLITFRSCFCTTPAVVLTQNYPDWESFSSSGGSTRDNVVIIAVNKDKVKVKTGNGDGDPTDRNFTFIAIGE
ncbi:MAG: hypothetical protein H6Q70_281 [Firmicutes bacterium]|nr:hypothetical protein [Bacillota bacterium]MBP2629653.1 hypothetical protein [Bacillota bacterium]